MKNLYILKSQLTPDQNKVFDEVIMQYEDTISAYKILSKKYSAVKRNVKAAEKKLVGLMNRLPEKSIHPMWVEGNIESIERKYIVIDKSIKNYKEQLQYFNRLFDMGNFRGFNPQHQHDWHISGLKNHLYMANNYIVRALDDIRITKRYFKNIAEAFKSFAEREKFQRSLALRRSLELQRVTETQVEPNSAATEDGDLVDRTP